MRCRPRAGSEKNEQKTFKNSTPSAAPGPLCQTGFFRLCSLYVVICVFFEDFGYGKTSKSPRTASTDGGSLLGNTGLALQRGAVFEVFSCCRQLFSQDPKLTPKRDPKSAKRDPKSASRAPKRTQTKRQHQHQHQHQHQRWPRVLFKAKRKLRRRGGSLDISNRRKV